MTTVGVVIGSFNHIDYLEDCLRSVENQSRPPDRIVVVDDGSNDGSAELAEAHASDVVEIIRTERVGTSIAYNTGIERIGTDIVAILAADDACVDHRLERQVEILEDGAVDVVIGLPIVMDEKSELRTDGLAGEFFSPAANSHDPLFGSLFRSGNFLCASTATFRRSAFHVLGGFHPGLLQLQDFHLWLRWSWRGLRRSEERFAFYRKSATSLSAPSNDRRMHSERAWIYRHAFDDVPDSVIAASFGPELRHRSHLVDRGLDIAMIHLQQPDPIIFQIGCELLHDVLSNENGPARLSAYGISMQDVFAWSAREATSVPVG